MGDLQKQHARRKLDAGLDVLLLVRCFTCGHSASLDA
jgi:hypothetical protein